MHYLIGFQLLSYSLTVIGASVCLCLERGIPSCRLTTNQQPTSRGSALLWVSWYPANIQSDLVSTYIFILFQSPTANWHGKILWYGHMETLKRLYVASIHPHLEYATAAWDSHLSKCTQKLYILHVGSVQKWKDNSYSNNHAAYLEHARKKKICHLYRIDHGFVDFPYTTLVLVQSPFSGRAQIISSYTHMDMCCNLDSFSGTPQESI